MADVLLYSVLELASAFAPNLATLLVLRTMFGFVMGGEWGIGASLALESIPAPVAGPRIGHPAGGLRGRPAARRAGVRHSLTAFRQPVPRRGALAAAVRDRRGPGPCWSSTWRRNVKESPSFEPAEADSARRAPWRVLSSRPELEAGALRHRPDDRVQLLQPRHPGQLRHLPRSASTASSRRRSDC